MSVTTTYHCNKCRSVIHEGRTSVEVVCGPLRRQHEHVDLCDACADAFAAFLATPPQGLGLDPERPLPSGRSTRTPALAH